MGRVRARHSVSAGIGDGYMNRLNGPRRRAARRSALAATAYLQDHYTNHASVALDRDRTAPSHQESNHPNRTRP